jgi:hypothetical protein
MIDAGVMPPDIRSNLAKAHIFALATVRMAGKD